MDLSNPPNPMIIGSLHRALTTRALYHFMGSVAEHYPLISIYQYIYKQGSPANLHEVCYKLWIVELIMDQINLFPTYPP